MQISSLVNTIPTRSASPRAPDPRPTSIETGQPEAGNGAAPAVPSFITPASLVSVSGGTAAVTLLWTVSKTLFGARADTPWVPFFCALIVGTAIYLISLQDQNTVLTPKDKTVGIIIAFLNSMVLFAAARGIVG